MGNLMTLGLENTEETGLGIVEVDSFEKIPENDARHLATMASIADHRINGANSRDFSAWFNMSSNGREIEARQILAIDKARTELDTLILSETEDPTMSTAEFFTYLNDKNDAEFKDKYRSILELETAESITEDSFTDPIRSAVIEMEDFPNLLTEEESDRLSSFEQDTNRAAGILKLNQMKGKYLKIFMDRGISEKAAQVLSLVIPLGESATQAVMTGRDVETLGDALSKGANEFWNSPNPVKFLEDIEKKFEETGTVPDFFKLDFLDNFSRSEGLRGLSTAFEIADMVGLGSLAKSLLSIPKLARLSKLARTAKNREMSVKHTTNIGKVKAEGGIVSKADEEEFVESVIPSSGNPFVNSTSGEAARLLDIQRRELEALQNIKGQEFLSDVERNKATEIVKQTIKETTKRGVVIDVSEPDNLGRVSFKLGTGEFGTSAHLSKEAAEGTAERLGLKKGFYDVVQEDGVYFVSVKRDLPTFDPNTGESLLTPMATVSGERTLPTLFKYLGPRGFAGTKVLLKHEQRLAEGGIVGTNAVARLNEVFNSTTKIFSTLSKKERATFEETMQFTQMNNGGRWLSYKEVNDFYITRYGRSPSDKEIAAYGGVIQLHQADEFILNTSIRNEFVAKNLQEIAIDGVQDSSVIGKVIPSMDRKNNAKNVDVLDATTGTLSAKGTSSAGALAKLKDNPNLVLVKYLQPVKTKFGKAQYIIASKQNVSTKAIRSRVLNHFDGPHREYKTPIFIKQAVVSEVEGSVALTGQRTIFNVGSEKQAIKAADDYNEALDAFLIAERANKTGDTALINKASSVISTKTRYANYDEFKKALEAGDIERTPFEAWADRGTAPLNNRKAGQTFSEEATDLDKDVINLSESARNLIDDGRLYFSARGPHKINPDGELAPVLDHTTTLENSMRHIISTRAFGEYKTRAIRNWVETFKHELVDGNIQRADWHHFTHGQFKTDTLPSIKDAAERSREGLNRIVGVMSPEAKEVNGFKYQLAQYVLDPDKASINKLGASTLLKVLDSEGATAIRGLTFKLFMGLLDVSQIGLQISMTPAVLGAFPRIGTQALTMLLPLRMATIVNKPSQIDHLVSVMSTLGLAVGKRPLKTKEVRMLVEDLKKSGADIVGGTQAQLDNPFDGTIVSRNLATRIASKAMDGGLIPFKEGEKLNQMLGFTIAWLEHFEKNGTRALGDDFGKLQNRAETISGNMKSSSKASWQKGILSMPTQFAAHPIRVLEHILEQSGGLTKTERLGFFGGIGLAYGAGGLGIDSLVDYLADEYQEATDEPITAEVRANIKNGFVGKVLDGSSVTRLQPLNDTMLHKIWDSLVGGEKLSLPEVFGGPSGSLVGRWAETIGSAILIRGMMDGSLDIVQDGPEESVALAKELFLAIPFPSRLHKAWRMHQENVLMSSGVVPKMLEQRNFSSFEKVMTGLGLPPIHSKEVYEATLEMKGLQEVIRKDAQVFTNYVRDAMLTEDKEASEKLLRRAQRTRNLYLVDKTKPHVAFQFNKATSGMLGNMGKSITTEGRIRLYQFFGTEKTNSMIRGIQ